MIGEELLQQLAAAPKGDGAQWTKEQDESGRMTVGHGR